LAQNQAAQLTIRDEWDGRAAIVTLDGEICMITVSDLFESLDLIVGKDPERLIIDLAGVSFLDSSAVHAFARARHMLPEECSVVLRSPQRQARRVFELTGLDSVCVIE
jgi:anti-anti-sigma factor